MQQRGIKLFGRQSTVIFSHREKKILFYIYYLKKKHHMSIFPVKVLTVELLKNNTRV